MLQNWDSRFFFPAWNTELVEQLLVQQEGLKKRGVERHVMILMDDVVMDSKAVRVRLRLIQLVLGDDDVLDAFDDGFVCVDACGALQEPLMAQWFDDDAEWRFVDFVARFGWRCGWIG